jgi:hypothetical protein
MLQLIAKSCKLHRERVYNNSPDYDYKQSLENPAKNFPNLINSLEDIKFGEGTKYHRKKLGQISCHFLMLGGSMGSSGEHNI